MLLLVTDTSGKNGFVALVRAAEDAKTKTVEAIEEVLLAGGTFSAQLVPQIAGLLTKHGFSKTDIAAFIVVSGPGSFTGLRVGLAAIKALAEILHKPIVPVSLLEVLAVASGVSGRVLAALDAGRGEVFVGEYDVSGEAAVLVGERLLTQQDFVAASQGISVATNDDALAQSVKAAAQRVSLVSVDAVKIASLGVRRMLAGDSVSPEQLDANYIRRSDAEIFFKPDPAKPSPAKP
jgi:tRNA threonylcarbamoyladenosine biosynthesis protein TsaB